MFFYFPLGFENRARAVSMIATMLILWNIGVFFVLAGLDARLFSFAGLPTESSVIWEKLGFIPASFSWRDTLTAIFLHVDIFHLGSNMYFLWLFGHRLEEEVGPLRMLAIYLGAGIGAACCVAWITPHEVRPHIGASGAVCGLIGASLVLFFREKIETRYLFFIFPFFKTGVLRLSMHWFIMLFFGIDFVAVGFGVGGGALAHVSGMVLGAAIAMGFHIMSKLGSVSEPERRPVAPRPVRRRATRLIGSENALFGRSLSECSDN